MAMKNAFMTTAKAGLSVGESLSLEAKTGSSLLIKDVIVRGANTPYADFYTEKTSVGRFRVLSSGMGNHLSAPQGNPIISPDSPKPAVVSSTLLRYMEDMGIMEGYPIGEGETFSVKPSDATKTLGDVIIVYAEYDAGDMKPTDKNGSKSAVYTMVGYGQVENDISVHGEYIMGKSNLPAEFPAFPFGEVVPANTLIKMYAVTGSEVERFKSSGNIIYTDRLKMIKDRQVLFDEEKEGMLIRGFNNSFSTAGYLIGGGISLIGGMGDTDGRLPFIYPVPMEFKSGEELGVYFKVADAGTPDPLEAEYTEVAFIMDILKGGV